MNTRNSPSRSIVFRRFLKKNAFLVLSLWCFVWPLRVVATGYQIESFVVGGGGGSSSGGDYALAGTAGEAGAGVMNGGGYTLAGGFWGAAFEVVLPPPDESFTAWMDALPPEEQPPEGQRGPLDAPAGDGMSNLLKYALGLMPMTPSRDGSPKMVLAPGQNGGEQRYLAVEFIASKTAAVSFQLESSANLSGWGETGFVIEQIEDIDADRKRIRLLSNISLDEHPQAFLRLRVSH